MLHLVKKAEPCRKDMEQENNVPTLHNNSAQAAQIIPALNQRNTYRPVGPQPVSMTCPNCRSRITTNLRHRSTAKTHVASLLLIPLCCCCLPYCMDTCRNVNHFCPMCETFLGTYYS